MLKLLQVSLRLALVESLEYWALAVVWVAQLTLGLLRPVVLEMQHQEVAEAVAV